jgi:hypothetical protein
MSNERFCCSICQAPFYYLSERLRHEEEQSGHLKLAGQLEGRPFINTTGSSFQSATELLLNNDPQYIAEPLLGNNSEDTTSKNGVEFDEGQEIEQLVLEEQLRLRITDQDSQDQDDYVEESEQQHVQLVQNFLEMNYFFIDNTGLFWFY